jgi:hypothetical protein
MTGRLGPRDAIAIGLLTFFIVTAYTMELYWLVYWPELPQRGDLMALLYRAYGQADTGYYGGVTSFEVGLESFHVVISQPLHLWLICAILWRSPYRYPLQLALASYVCYSTVLFLTAKFMSGYAQMPVHDLGSQLMLHLANMPWIAGNLYLAIDAGIAITSRCRVAAAYSA